MPPLSGKDTHLYGAPRPKTTPTPKDLNNSTNTSFNTALSSLITSSRANHSSSTPRLAAGRPRPAKKGDIFTTHNRNIKKRAAADMLGREAVTKKGEELDDVAWRRAKRKLEEKARLYAAMKRGDVEDGEERHMVDFDRKWAEREEAGDADKFSDQSDSEDDSVGEAQEVVEYVDEFGRSRQGTRREVERERQRRNRAQTHASTADRFTARPSEPTNIIFGDTIQHHAFDPDEQRRTAMEALAKKREDTPPPETHYDGHAEIRTKGQGFFHFSTDEEERRKELESLEKARQETEKARADKDREKDQQRELRKKEIEQRRQEVERRRREKMADKFFDSFSPDLTSKAPGG